MAAGRRAPAVRDSPRTYARLREAYPDARCELDFTSPFELLIAVVLSAQTTDVAVNQITPRLFAAYPDARRLAAASTVDVEQKLNRIGMFRQKARNVVGLAQKLVEHHGGQVPRTLEELIDLPGVGRKTANAVLGIAFGAPEGVVVDTHVLRLAQRLGWSQESTPEGVETDLMRLFPREEWDRLAHTLIFHGRRTCTALKPACSVCPVNDLCPSAFHAEHIGRKTPRSRNAGSSTARTPAVGAHAARQVTRAKRAAKG